MYDFRDFRFEPDKLRLARLMFNPPHSQERCAQQIGVSWITVNRWENKRSMPTSGPTLKAIELYIQKAMRERKKVLQQAG